MDLIPGAVILYGAGVQVPGTRRKPGDTGTTRSLAITNKVTHIKSACPRSSNDDPGQALVSWASV
ncbi:hypothetical protein BBEV_3137 [Salisediminibacterium beveridgei]|uniref:Uncharacterized protein n=1 Tax=Salisediminibacterium beveridgei TaxID=632773 RepID=A0A1D7QZL0_9BACI|nr:hypothetical protein BBEV_3137 [Salisediminibacterium beveridgei]